MNDKPTYKELENQIAELQKQNEILHLRSSFHKEEKAKCADELRKAEEKSEENTKLLSVIARNFPNSYISVINKDLTIGFTSGEEFYKQNLNPNDFVGLTLEQVFGKNTEFVKNKYLKVFAGEKQSFELFIGNQYQLYKAVPLYDENNEIPQILAVAENITSRKVEEQIIQASEERFSTYINSTSDMVFTLDVEQRHTGIYGDWYKKAGMLESDFLGKTGKEILGEGSETHEEANEKVLKGEFIVYDWSTKIDDKSVYYQTSLSPLKNKNNEIVGIIGIGRNISKQKEAEAVLKESEIKYKDLVETADIAILIDDEDGFFEYFNSRFCKIFGYTKKEIASLAIRSLVHPDDVELVMNRHNNRISGKVVKSEYEFRGVRKNGEIVHLMTSAVPFKPNGKIIGSRSYVWDISERKQVQLDLLATKEQAEESEELFRHLFENMSSGVAIYETVDKGSDFRFKNFNSAAEKIDNIPKEKVIGNNMTKVFPGAIELGFLEVLKRVWETGISEHFPISFYQDDRISGWRENYVYKLSSGEIVTIYDDITERKLAEQTLKENENLLAETQKISKMGGWSYDVQPKKMTFTDTMFEIYGKSIHKAEEGIQYYHPDDKKLVWNAYSEALSKQKAYDLEVRFINAQGDHLYVRTIGRPVIEDGKVIKVNGILMDITQRKKAELKLKASEQKLKVANATKDKFFSIIAHDLRSPFNNIIGFSELLVENSNDYEAEEIEKFLSIINSSAKNTLAFLDNLLNWAKSQTGQISFKLEKVVLSSVIQKVIELLNPNAKNKNIVIHYSQSEEINVFADLNMIKTILRNLISNAIKFTNLNGIIEVTALQNDNCIEITVSDNGVGMDEETQNKLFRIETNETTMGTAKEKGSGLGLILCKEFVEMHGGKIWLESELGKGSVFRFNLPLIKLNECD